MIADSPKLRKFAPVSPCMFDLQYTFFKPGLLFQLQSSVSDLWVTGQNWDLFGNCTECVDALSLSSKMHYFTWLPHTWGELSVFGCVRFLPRRTALKTFVVEAHILWVLRVWSWVSQLVLGIPVVASAGSLSATQIWFSPGTGTQMDWHGNIISCVDPLNHTQLIIFQLQRKKRKSFSHQLLKWWNMLLCESENWKVNVDVSCSPCLNKLQDPDITCLITAWDSLSNPLQEKVFPTQSTLKITQAQKWLSTTSADRTE